MKVFQAKGEAYDPLEYIQHILPLFFFGGSFLPSQVRKQSDENIVKLYKTTGWMVPPTWAVALFTRLSICGWCFRKIGRIALQNKRR
jgi:hypothetical protein